MGFGDGLVAGWLAGRENDRSLAPLVVGCR